MSPEDRHQKIIEIVAEQAMVDASDVSADTTLEELDIDSLGVVEIVFAIEESFEISVPFNANDPSDNQFDVSTVGGMISAVEDLIKAKA